MQQPARRISVSSSTESVEALVCVADERQREGALLALAGAVQVGFRLSAQLCRVVHLRDLVDREVLRVDIALQLGLEGRADLAKAIPLHALEEGVRLQLYGALGFAEAVRRVADESVRSASLSLTTVKMHVRFDKVLGLRSELLVRREVQVTGPVHNLAVRVVRLLSAERWPSDQTLEHDRAHAPPIAAEVVALAAEDLGCDVVRCTHSRVGELTPRLTPGVDLVAIGNRKLDLIDRDRVAILRHRLRSSLGHELLRSTTLSVP